MESIVKTQGQDTPVKATPWFVEFAYKFGIPATIAVYLVWQLSTTYSTKLEALADKHERHQQEAQKQTDILEQTQDSNYRIEGYLRILCVNAAQDLAERNTCLSVR